MASKPNNSDLPEFMTSASLAEIIVAVLDLGTDTLAGQDTSILHGPAIRAAKVAARQLRAYATLDTGSESA